MLRERLARRGFGGEEGFDWRGREVSRLEGFSDAVFAFAVTLLVVSLEVPSTFDELLATMRGFFAFAVCFWLLFVVWHDHYRYFRRYGISDGTTARLTAALLFIVLSYVYPLKFLLTMLADQLLGFSAEVRLPSGAMVEAIRDEQWPLLMAIYGAGFVAVQLVFVVFYVRAHAMRADLGLSAREVSMTREELHGFLINTGVGLASVAIASFGTLGAAALAGWTYLLILPLQVANAHVMAAWRRKDEVDGD
jgi:hypothetical protein